MKNREFDFIIDVPPDKEIVAEFHREFAKDLIKKYGVVTMKDDLRRMKEAKKKSQELFLTCNHL